MAEQVKANNNQNNVPMLVKFEVPKTLEFNDVISTATVTSSDLEKEIANFFGSTFVDFEGCKILPAQVPGQPETLQCRLYFKPSKTKGEGLYAVKVRGEELVNPNSKGKNIRLSEVVNTINMLSTSKQFELDEIAKEMLSEFLIVTDAKVVDRYDEEFDRVVKVRLPKNWNSYVEEVTDTVGNTRFQNPYLVVTLNLLPIVAKLYGKKDEVEVKTLEPRGITPKDRYQYSVTVVKVLNPLMSSLILEIRRLDTKALNSLAHSIGYGMVTGNIVMTRR